MIRPFLVYLASFKLLYLFICHIVKPSFISIAFAVVL